MLKDKIALVTGAGRGIGREIALTLAKNGATVIVNYNGSKDAADEVVSAITQDGGSAEAIQCNVSDYAASEAFVKTVLEKYKKVDILVNNAGVTRDYVTGNGIVKQNILGRTENICTTCKKRGM